MINIILMAFSIITSITAFAQTQNLILDQDIYDNMHITSGKITKSNNILYIDDYGVRAEFEDNQAQNAQIQFKYLGQSTIIKPLRSGELRQQIGLKLNAQNTCNVLYIMRHIKPKSALGVSLKFNPNLSTHKQCQDNGYINLTPQYTMPLPPIIPNQWYILNAQIYNNNLIVYANNKLVWQGILPPQANFKGPAGFRTDNGKFAVIFTSSKNSNN